MPISHPHKFGERGTSLREEGVAELAWISFVGPSEVVNNPQLRCSLTFIRKEEFTVLTRDLLQKPANPDLLCGELVLCSEKFVTHHHLSNAANHLGFHPGVSYRFSWVLDKRTDTQLQTKLSCWALNSTANRTSLPREESR